MCKREEVRSLERGATLRVDANLPDKTIACCSAAYDLLETDKVKIFRIPTMAVTYPCTCNLVESKDNTNRISTDAAHTLGLDSDFGGDVISVIPIN